MKCFNESFTRLEVQIIFPFIAGYDDLKNDAIASEDEAVK